MNGAWLYLYALIPSTRWERSFLNANDQRSH